jgi:hypothetical protein
MVRPSWNAALLLAAASCGVLACEGSLSGPSPSEAPAASAGSGAASGGAPAASLTPPGFLPSGEPRATPLRRLTRSEYRNITHQLFGVEPPPSSLLPEDSLSSGFTSTAGQLVTIAAAHRYLDAASDLATKLEPELRALIPCAAADAAGELTCIDGFLSELGSRLFRRPMSEQEKLRYTTAFSRERATGSYESSASLVVEALLVAPEFLFVEQPSGGMPGAKQPLDGWQVASRLSLLLWDSIPDQPLLIAARAGQLTTQAAVAEQIDRMLLDPQTRAPIRSFFDDWLQLSGIEHIARDAGVYPLVTKELLGALAEESRGFSERVFWEDNDFRKLFVSPARFRSQALSAFYGDALGQSASVDAYQAEISERNFGLLSQAGFLMTLAQSEKSAPIQRGVFLRRRLLCGVMPPPPPGLATPLPEITPGVTTRQRITEHTAQGVCFSCHQHINPLGFALGHFDIAGQWREQDQGQPIDTLTRVDEAGFRGDVDGARALSEELAQSPNAQACAVQQLFTFALERAPVAADQPLFEALEQKFVSSGFSLKALLAGLALSDDFRTRIEPPEPLP